VAYLIPAPASRPSANRRAWRSPHSWPGRRRRKPPSEPGLPAPGASRGPW